MRIIDQEQTCDVTNEMLVLFYGDTSPYVSDDAFFAELRVILGRPETNFTEALVQNVNRIPDDKTLVTGEFDLVISNSDYWSEPKTMIFSDETLASNPVGCITDLVMEMLYASEGLFSASLALDRSISNPQMDHERIKQIAAQMAASASEQVRWDER